MQDGNTLILVTLYIVYGLAGSAMLFALARLVLGPSILDRVVALDLIAALTTGLIAVYAIHTDEPVFLRAAIALALLSFLGTIAFAYYVEKGGTA
jgi:multicomponent Na+:H+ antiporter subunit F